MLTRNDIARLAGVSTATVSRAFNQPEAVEAAKRERIFAVARQAGYRPNLNASALRGRGSRSILFLEVRPAPDQPAPPPFNALFYAMALKQVKPLIEEQFFHLTMETVEREPGAMEKVLARAPCRGIIAYQILTPSVIQEIAQTGIPCVACHHTAHLEGINCCYTDDFRGGALVGEKLQQAGRRYPVHVTDTGFMTRVLRQRWEGFQSAYPANQQPELVHGELSCRGGEQAVESLLPRIRRGEIDAIFAHNDLVAVGVINALLRAGVRIPQDVAVVGYDKSPFTDLAAIPLATVDQRLQQTYAEAVQLLFDIMQTPPPAPIRHAVAPAWVDGASLPPV